MRGKTMPDFEQVTKTTYEKWYARCLKVLADDERYHYVHPSDEIRLELMRLTPREEEDNPGDSAPSLAVTLELFYNDPLLSVHMGMWTQNPAGMAMLFAGLELMEKEVDSN